MADAKEPAWVTARVDQLIAKVRHVLGEDVTFPQTLVMTPLTEPDENSSPAEWEVWERTCDNCGKHCPHPEKFYSGHVVRHVFGTQMLITFGVCSDCRKVS